MDHSALSQAPLSNDDDPISPDYPMITKETYHQSKSHCSGQPSSLAHDHEDIVMDHPAKSISLFPMMMLVCLQKKILMAKSMAYPTYIDLDRLQMVLKR
jgi:hypothetical protein